jgi:hypothetical protein
MSTDEPAWPAQEEVMENFAELYRSEFWQESPQNRKATNSKS